jgi:hypothetical protein
MGVVSSDSHTPAGERTRGLDGGKADSVAQKFSSEGSASESAAACVDGVSPPAGPRDPTDCEVRATGALERRSRKGLARVDAMLVNEPGS